MKFYKKMMLALCVVLASSCTLDLREDPNAVQPDQVLPSLLLNTMQANLAGLFNGASGAGAAITRQLNAGSSVYNTTVTPEGFNGIWATAYAGLMEDGVTLLETADENGFARHAGMARVMQAYTIVTLVDFFGAIPYSEAFQGSANFDPNVDDEAELYALALEMLNKAKVDLSTNLTTAAVPGYLNPVAPAITDMYYSNNYTKWIKLANTLKLKIYLNLKDVEPTAATEINALIADATPTGGLITADNENFIFRYSTNTSDPDSRHPAFIGQYIAGGGAYQSNWLMWHMFHGYDATNAGGSSGDPRMRFYFYRQTTANSTSSNEIRCLTESLPNHYPTSTGAGGAILDAVGGRPPMGVGANHPTNDPADPAWNRTFCYPTNAGYWGRDHVDPQGIPPDGLLRTAFGAYPVGGRFDNNAGAAVASGQGMRGAGFEPIMMRSYVQFMLAEATLYLGTTGSARTYFQNGINYSMTDVRTWSTAGTFGTSSIAASPTEASTINSFYSSSSYSSDVTNYLNSALAAFDAMMAVLPFDNKNPMNYIAREYWIASFGNGVEAYNLYRRTGLPTGMQPVINPQPGSFPRSFWYPANFANLNKNVEQKADMKTPVFWNEDNTNLDF